MGMAEYRWTEKAMAGSGGTGEGLIASGGAKKAPARSEGPKRAWQALKRLGSSLLSVEGHTSCFDILKTKESMAGSGQNKEGLTSSGGSRKKLPGSAEIRGWQIL